MHSVSIYEAKTHLSSLIASIERLHETVIIMRHGQAVAELVPIPRGSRIRQDPVLKKVRIKGDLTAPSGEEWENA